MISLHLKKNCHFLKLRSAQRCCGHLKGHGQDTAHGSIQVLLLPQMIFSKGLLPSMESPVQGSTEGCLGTAQGQVCGLLLVSAWSWAAQLKTSGGARPSSMGLRFLSPTPQLLPKAFLPAPLSFQKRLASKPYLVSGDFSFLFFFF